MTLVGVIANVIMVGGAVWGFGLLAPNVFVHGALVVGFVAVDVALCWVILGQDLHGLRKACAASALATLVVAVAAGAWFSKPTEVNEQVVTAAPKPSKSTPERRGDSTGSQNVLIASGDFESLAHETKGDAQLIDVAKGSDKLVLRGFKTDPGPDLFVYAVAGNPQSDSDVTDYINLGKLKGTSGNQQYSVPKDFDSKKYRNIYIWCRAFTVGFGRAKLA